MTAANRSLPVMVLLAASVLWGAAWWPLKQLNALGIEGVPLIAVAYGAITLCLLPVVVRQRRDWRGETGALVLILCLGGYANVAFNLAMIYGEVVRVMVLFYLLPLWGVLGGRLFLGERIDAARALAMLLALGGAVLILGGVEVLQGDLAWTDILAITCGMAFAGNNLVFRARQRLPVPTKVAAMLIGSFLLVLPLVFAGIQPWPQLVVADWAWVVAYGLLWLLLATIGTQWAVTHLEAGRASILIIMELVTAVVTATLIGGEVMTGSEMFGGALILIAAVVEARRAGVDAAPVPA